MTAVDLTDEDLVERFERATLAAGQFGHAEHVRAAWLFVRRYGLPDALAAFPAALRRFALAKGAPHLYHVTITWAYLLLIHARQQTCQADVWQDFASANTDLLTWKPSILDDYYTPETLWSEFARHTFVMPDRGMLARSGAASDATHNGSHGLSGDSRVRRRAGWPGGDSSLPDSPALLALPAPPPYFAAKQ